MIIQISGRVVPFGGSTPVAPSLLLQVASCHTHIYRAARAKERERESLRAGHPLSLRKANYEYTRPLRAGLCLVIFLVGIKKHPHDVGCVAAEPRHDCVSYLMARGGSFDDGMGAPPRNEP